MSSFLLVIAALLAFVIIPIVFLIAFIKPSALNIKTNKNPTGKTPRKSLLIGLVVAWLVSMGIGIANTPDETEANKLNAEVEETKEDEEAKKNEVEEIKEDEDSKKNEVEEIKEDEGSKKNKVEKIKEAKTFGITPDEFGKRFMAEASKTGLGEFSWNDGFDITEGRVNDTFTVLLSDAVAMNGTVDKNGELKGVTFTMGKTDKGDQEAMNLMVMASLTARALNPDLPKEQTAGVVGRILSEAADQFNKTGEGEASEVVGNVKYSTMAGNGMGLWIFFEPAE